MVFGNTLVAAAILAPFALQVYGAACVRTYTVVEGDICDGISASQSVSTFQLAAVNAGVIDDLCYNLEIDSTICLGTEGEDCTETYVVQEDDSCDAISESFGINSTILMTNNPNIDENCGNIYTGEVLCVSSEITVPAIPEGFFDTSDPAPSTTENDNTEWIPVDEDEVDDGEDLPYCDEVF